MRTRAGRRLAVMLVATLLGAAGACGAFGVLGASRVARAASPARSDAPVGADPSVFVDSRAVGSGTVLELRSTTTGAVLGRLGRFGSSFTNNGLALAPNGQSVFFTLIPPAHPRTSNLIMARISTTTRAVTTLARGEVPAVSPDSRQLAYVTGPHARSVAVRDLRSNRIRSIDLTSLVGAQADVFNGTLAWLANGRQLALLTSTTSPVRVARGLSSSPSAAGGRSACSTAGVRTCLVLLELDRGRSPITARDYAVPDGVSAPSVVGADAAAPDSVLIAGSGAAGTAVVDRLTPTGQTLALQQLASVRSGLALSFDATGSHLLYLAGHSPLALWSATVTPTGLRSPRRLISNPQLGSAAW
jgi:hypothetical protein